MKILYIDQPLEPPGGGQFSLLLLLRYLNKEKFKPIVFIHKDGQFAKMLKENDIEYHIVKLSSLFFEIRKQDPQIIHCNSATTKYTFMSLVIAKFLNIPFVWHNRVIDSAGWKDRIIFNLSDRVVVISDAVRKKFSSFKNQDKIVKIYNGVDLEKFNPNINGENIKKEFNILPNENVIGCIARFDKWKGLEYFIDMAKIIVEKNIPTKFFLVGDGIERRNLQLKVKNYGLEDKFFFTGFRENAAEFIALFDILIIPTSEEEPFGRVAIEGMACGKPVVATKTGGLVEIIEDKITGILVPPKSAQSLAEACIWLIQNKQEAKKISIKAREKVKESFSITQNVKKVEMLYEEILNNI
jgi:glycosyltransferase involved in cell wall biosynthesis